MTDKIFVLRGKTDSLLFNIETLKLIMSRSRWMARKIYTIRQEYKRVVKEHLKSF